MFVRIGGWIWILALFAASQAIAGRSVAAAPPCSQSSRSLNRSNR